MNNLNSEALNGSNTMDPVERLGRRIDAVRQARYSGRSKWAFDYWSLVEKQLMRRFVELEKHLIS
jgi:hypothetical protein